jgi:hypothetical protein
MPHGSVACKGRHGKLRSARPAEFEAAHTLGWAAAAHFLLVQVSGSRASVVPIGEDGEPLAVAGPGGEPVPATTVVELP